ncbi:hypothetical protein ABT127_16860 [Streptomyces sp. NPDC001904]|uniref:WXG100 family type VII secretion target n=1 Tax=Streptomyces sp. NPDC001904 TaxID=3154531 RepID=UPI00331A85B7
MSDKGADYNYQAPTQCYVGEHTSDFKNHDMDQMKAMVQNANPSDVHHAANGWKGVHDQLVDVKAVYEAAVSEVLKDWEGASADQFQARSKIIAKKIEDTSTYATYVSTAMTSAAVKLDEIKPEVMAMQKPSKASSIGDRLTDGGRDTDGLDRDIANSSVSAQDIVDNREGDMSAGREAQMKMAVKMEDLGGAYNAQTKSMGSWKRTQESDTEDYPGSPGGVAPVPIFAGSVGAPSAGAASGRLSRSSSGSGSSIAAVQSPNASSDGISGGIGSQKPAGGSQIGAGNLSFGGSGAGAGAVGAGTGIGAGGGISGGVAGPGAGAGAGAIGGAGIGGAIGAGAGLGGRGGAGAGGRTGAVGRGGLGAGGTGSGAAGKTGAKGLKGSSLARTKGGAIGKSVVKPGSAQQGGSALRQKPKTATGGTGAGAGRNGLAGRGAQTNSKDKKRRDKSRPDYLVEDEQTWANDRTVNPKVVE